MSNKPTLLPSQEKISTLNNNYREAIEKAFLDQNKDKHIDHVNGNKPSCEGSTFAKIDNKIDNEIDEGLRSAWLTMISTYEKNKT
jgi:hypothetical protein